MKEESKRKTTQNTEQEATAETKRLRNANEKQTEYLLCRCTLAAFLAQDSVFSSKRISQLIHEKNQQW